MCKNNTLVWKKNPAVENCAPLQTSVCNYTPRCVFPPKIAISNDTRKITQQHGNF